MSTTRKPIRDLTGVRFNNLEVVEYLGIGKHKKHYWRCKCDCGGTVDLPSGAIDKPYSVKTCGCLRKEKLLKVRFNGYKHGLHKHPLYGIYHTMKYRCSSPKSCRWKYYGGKGIKVCDEWLEDFMNFYNWAIEHGYEEGLTIDRIDPDKGYEPDNCEWVTRSENSRRMNVIKHGK